LIVFAHAPVRWTNPQTIAAEARELPRNFKCTTEWERY
jgi:hypothetical protein